MDKSKTRNQRSNICGNRVSIRAFTDRTGRQRVRESATTVKILWILVGLMRARVDQRDCRRLRDCLWEERRRNGHTPHAKFIVRLDRIICASNGRCKDGGMWQRQSVVGRVKKKFPDIGLFKIYLAIHREKCIVSRLRRKMRLGPSIHPAELLFARFYIGVCVLKKKK